MHMPPVVRSHQEKEVYVQKVPFTHQMQRILQEELLSYSSVLLVLTLRKQIGGNQVVLRTVRREKSQRYP